MGGIKDNKEETTCVLCEANNHWLSRNLSGTGLPKNTFDNLNLVVQYILKQLAVPLMETCEAVCHTKETILVR